MERDTQWWITPAPPLTGVTRLSLLMSWRLMECLSVPEKVNVLLLSVGGERDSGADRS